MLCRVVHGKAQKVLGKSLFCIDFHILSMGRILKVSFMVYLVMSIIMSDPLLYFKIFCSHIPSYPSACVKFESCMPVRLNLGSMLRSCLSIISLKAISLANAFAF